MIDPRPLAFEIEDRKLVSYLLDIDSEDGGPKAARYLRHKFTPETLRSALIEHGNQGRFDRGRDTPYGWIIEIVEPMMTPLNTYLNVRSVWEIRPAQPAVARLVTTTFETS